MPITYYASLEFQKTQQKTNSPRPHISHQKVVFIYVTFISNQALGLKEGIKPTDSCFSFRRRVIQTTDRNCSSRFFFPNLFQGLNQGRVQYWLESQVDPWRRQLHRRRLSSLFQLLRKSHLYILLYDH